MMRLGATWPTLRFGKFEKGILPAKEKRIKVKLVFQLRPMIIDTLWLLTNDITLFKHE